MAKKNSVLKILGIGGLVLGLGSSLINDYVGEKKLDEKIDTKIDDKLAKAIARLTTSKDEE